MEVIYFEKIEDIKKVDNLSLVLGNFDGVHVGHAQLFNFAILNKKGKVGVLTFDKPIKNKEGCLTSLNDKIEIFEKMGLDYAFILKVDDTLKRYSYLRFIDTVLKGLDPVKIFVGPDFRFGYMAKGDIYSLKERFNEVYVINFVKDHNNEKISSTSIRELIKEGKIYEANRWLGRSYRMSGIVEKGKGKGRTIGFPTANLKLIDNYIIPKEGVYITTTIIENKRYHSLTNIGKNPTISDKNRLTIETYIFDFKDELYDKPIKLEFFKYLRGEVKFSSIEDLHHQLEKDMDDATYYFEYIRNLNDIHY